MERIKVIDDQFFGAKDQDVLHERRATVRSEKSSMAH